MGHSESGVNNAANNANGGTANIGYEDASDSDDSTYVPSETDNIRFSSSEDEIIEDDGFAEYGIVHDLPITSDPNQATEGQTEIQQDAQFNSDDEAYESEEILSSDSEDEDGNLGKKHFTSFVMPVPNMKDYKWKVGTTFVNKAEFTNAVNTYQIHNGKNMKWTHSDKFRARKRCVGNKVCKFYLYASYLSTKGCWQLKAVGPKHECATIYNTKKPKRKWLATWFKDNVRRNPEMKGKEIKSTMSEEFDCGFSMTTATRAKKDAKSIVEGNVAATYTRVYDFAAEILRSNEGSTTIVHPKWPEDYDPNVSLGRVIYPWFQRLYVCLDGPKRSFLSACRPIISIDGCFLKTKYKGQLLTAVARDPNDQMLPLAFAVVENENKSSWCWFLDLLQKDIGDYKDNNWTFISDQQKGLVPAFDAIMPGVDHRYCVRHLYGNVRKRWSEHTLKGQMWSAAVSTYDQEFDRNMEVIKASNKAAYDHIAKLEKRYWTKSAFSTYPKCDTVLNNMSETFNYVILEQRELPMTTMVDSIITYMMTRWQTNRSKILKYTHDICPRIRSRLDKYAKESGRWVPVCSAKGLFQVSKDSNRFVVNLNEWICSCRRWQVSGIPCSHAIACMRRFGDDVCSYIPHYFKRQAYEACYGQVIKPMNGSNMWPKTGNIDLLPPPLPEKKTAGKLAKKRRKEAGENGSTRGGSTLTSHGKEMTCGNCLQRGHYRSSCKAPTHPDARPPRRRWVPPTSSNTQSFEQDIPAVPSQQVISLTQNAPLTSVQVQTGVADDDGWFGQEDWDVADQFFTEWQRSQDGDANIQTGVTHGSIVRPLSAESLTAKAVSRELNRDANVQSCQRGKIQPRRGSGRGFKHPRPLNNEAEPSTRTITSSRLSDERISSLLGKRN